MSATLAISSNGPNAGGVKFAMMVSLSVCSEATVGGVKRVPKVSLTHGFAYAMKG